MDYKVVFHLHEEEKAQIAVSNTTNLLNDFGKDDLEVELVKKQEEC